jgi:thermostable 8-oxoguanine DNA glycosylase
MRNLASRFEGIKETNASGFLKYCGLDIPKIGERHVQRTLYRIGLIDSKKASYRDVYDACEKIAKAVGLKKKGLAVIDLVLWAYGSKGICGKRPVCEDEETRNECPLTETKYCSHFNKIRVKS